MTKVSIIITNYNYGEYLLEAIMSALDQDYPQEDLEIILIDDASTDEETRKLVESYEHPRVKKILLKENVGVVRARNMAIEVAGGGYILPLDADDYFARDYVRLAAQVLDSQPHVGMVYAYGRLVGAIQGPWLAPCTQEELIFNEGVPAPSMYRKSIWQEVGGYHDYMYDGREDWDFSLSVMEKGWKVHALSETPGIYYRIKSGSRSSEAEKQQSFLLMKIYENHKELFLSCPHQVAKMFYKCYALRRYYQTEEFILGNRVIKPIAKIRNFVHYGMHWIKDKWMGRKMI